MVPNRKESYQGHWCQIRRKAGSKDPVLSGRRFNFNTLTKQQLDNIIKVILQYDKQNENLLQNAQKLYDVSKAKLVDLLRAQQTFMRPHKSARCWHMKLNDYQGKQHPNIEVQVREHRVPFPSQILQAAECQDLLCFSSRRYYTCGNGAIPQLTPPRTMVPDGASCGIWNTCIVTNYVKRKVRRKCKCREINFFQ